MARWLFWPFLWYAEAFTAIVKQRRLENETSSAYNIFWQKYFGRNLTEIFQESVYDTDKWIDCEELLVVFSKAARLPLRITDYDMRTHFDRFVYELTRQLEQGEIEGYRKEGFNSVAGIYLRAADIWNAIQRTKLPDGGISVKNFSKATYVDQDGMTKVMPNQDARKTMDGEGKLSMEYLDIKTPLVFAMAYARNHNNSVKALTLYDFEKHGELVPTIKNPDPQ